MCISHTASYGVAEVSAKARLQWLNPFPFELHIMELATFNASNSHIFESALRMSINKLEEFQNSKTPKQVRKIILINNLSNYICKLLDDLIMQENPFYIPKKLTAPAIDHFEIQSKLKQSNGTEIVIQKQIKFKKSQILEPKSGKVNYTRSNVLIPITGCFFPDLFGRSDSIDYLNISNSPIFLPIHAKTTIKDFTSKEIPKKDLKKWNWNLFKRTNKQNMDEQMSHSQSSITLNWSQFDHAETTDHTEVSTDISWESDQERTNLSPNLDLDKPLKPLSIRPISTDLGSIDAWIASTKSTSVISSNSTRSKSTLTSTVRTYTTTNTKPQSVISQPSNNSKSVMSQPSNNSKSVISQPSNNSKSVISQPSNNSKSVISQPSNNSKSVISQPSTNSKSVNSQPSKNSKGVNYQPAVTTSAASKASSYHTATSTSISYHTANSVHNSLDQKPDGISNDANTNSKRQSMLTNFTTSYQTQTDEEINKISVSNYLTNLSMPKKTNRYTKTTENGFENLRLMREKLRSKQKVKSNEPLEITDDKILKEVVGLKSVKRKSSRLSISMVLDQDFLKSIQSPEELELEPVESGIDGLKAQNVVSAEVSEDRGQGALRNHKKSYSESGIDGLKAQNVVSAEVQHQKEDISIKSSDECISQVTCKTKITTSIKSPIALDPTESSSINYNDSMPIPEFSIIADKPLLSLVIPILETNVFKTSPSIKSPVAIVSDLKSPMISSIKSPVSIKREHGHIASIKDEIETGSVSGISRMVKRFELSSNQDEPILRNFQLAKKGVFKHFETPMPANSNENPGNMYKNVLRSTKSPNPIAISNENSNDAGNMYKNVLKSPKSPMAILTNESSITTKNRYGAAISPNPIETHAVSVSIDEYSNSPVQTQNASNKAVQDAKLVHPTLIPSVFRKPVPAHINIADKSLTPLVPTVKKTSSEVNEIQNMIRRFELAKSANPKEIIIPERSTSRQSNGESQTSAQTLSHIENTSSQGSVVVPERTASASNCWTCKSKTLTCPKHAITQTVTELRKKTFRDHNNFKKQTNSSNLDESNSKPEALSYNGSDIYIPQSTASSNHSRYQYSKEF
jgi:hypothetical protein